MVQGPLSWYKDPSRGIRNHVRGKWLASSFVTRVHGLFPPIPPRDVMGNKSIRTSGGGDETRLRVGPDIFRGQLRPVSCTHADSVKGTEPPSTKCVRAPPILHASELPKSLVGPVLQVTNPLHGPTFDTFYHHPSAPQLPKPTSAGPLHNPLGPRPLHRPPAGAVKGCVFSHRATSSFRFFCTRSRR